MFFFFFTSLFCIKNCASVSKRSECFCVSMGCVSMRYILFICECFFQIYSIPMHSISSLPLSCYSVFSILAYLLCRVLCSHFVVVHYVLIQIIIIYFLKAHKWSYTDISIPDCYNCTVSDIVCSYSVWFVNTEGSTLDK